MMKRMYLTLGMLWVLSVMLVVAVGCGPDLLLLLQPASEVQAVQQASSSLERLIAAPWSAGGMLLTIILSLITVGVRLYAGSQQQQAARTAARHSQHYQLTVAQDEAVEVKRLRAFWLGVRRGLQATTWQRLTGRAPYLIWTYLGSQHGSRLACYVTVVGEVRAQQAVRKALLALNPTMQVRDVDDPRQIKVKASRQQLALQLGLAASYPIKTAFDDSFDPLTVLYRHLEAAGGVELCGVDVVMRPASDGWAVAGRNLVKRTRSKDAGKKAAGRNVAAHELAADVEEKAQSDAYGWNCYFQAYAVGKSGAVVEKLGGIAHDWFGFYSFRNFFKAGAIKSGQPSLGYPVSFADRDILSPAECAALCHLPSAADVPGLTSSGSAYLPPGSVLARVPLVNGLPQYQPPPCSPDDDPESLMQQVIPDGYHDYGDGTAGIVGHTVEMSMRMHEEIGPMGVGKSTLIGNQARRACDVGGVMVVEPAYDLTRRMLETMPRKYWRRVFYIEPGELYRRGRAFTLNVMELPNAGLINEFLSLTMLILRTMVGSKTWDSAPRMQTIMEASVKTLLETVTNSTFRDLFEFVNNPGYRAKLTGKVRSTVIRDYWQLFFAEQKPEKQQEMVAPVITRVIKFLMNDYAASIVSSRKSTLNMRAAMDEGKILLVNLPGAGNPEDGGDPVMSFIGMLLVMRVRLAANSRGDIAESKRRPFHVFLDEGHNFITPDIEKAYTELRKFRVSTTIAHQNTGQIDRDVMKVILDSVGNRYCFRAEAGDAKLLADDALGKQVTAYDLSRLENRRAYVRLMKDGSPQPVCTINTFPPAPPTPFDYELADFAAGREYVRQQHPAVSAAVAHLLELVAQQLAASEAAHLDPTDAAKQQAVLTSYDVALLALKTTSATDFARAQQLQAERDHALADWLAANPGACINQTELLKWLSMLDNTLPRVLIQAEAEREGETTSPSSGWE